jgi:hypothetical protein
MTDTPTNATRTTRPGEPTTEPIEPLAVGHMVRFSHPAGEARRWWTVRAGDDRYTILTRQQEFRPRGRHLYTIIDRTRGVRGPCNLIGGGWDIDEPDGPDSLLRALQYHDELQARLAAGEGSVVVEEHAVEVSHRNNVRVEISQTRPAQGVAPIPRGRSPLASRP